MESICSRLMDDHKRCDDLLMQADIDVSHRDWDEAKKNFLCFHGMLLRHIAMEESILFPAFEKVVLNAGYPLALLCMEHRHIRGIADRLIDSLDRHEQDEFILHSETFTLLMQQHHLKEEEIIYPVLDRILGNDTRSILFAMRTAMTMPDRFIADTLHGHIIRPDPIQHLGDVAPRY